MRNRDKYKEEIVELSAEGKRIAIDKHTKNLTGVMLLTVRIAISVVRTTLLR